MLTCDASFLSFPFLLFFSSPFLCFLLLLLLLSFFLSLSLSLSPTHAALVNGSVQFFIENKEQRSKKSQERPFHSAEFASLRDISLSLREREREREREKDESKRVSTSKGV